MRGWRRLSDDAWQAIMRRYRAGDERLSKIAAEHGISVAAITQHARRHGFTFGSDQPGAKRPANPGAKRAPARPAIAAGGNSAAEILRLRAMRKTRSEIAALLRVPYREIEAVLARAGEACR